MRALRQRASDRVSMETASRIPPLAALRDTLLPKLISGELRVRMPAKCSRKLRYENYCRSRALPGFGYHNATVPGAAGFLASSAGDGR